MPIYTKPCEKWWEDFVLEHGPASSMHTAFLGYLVAGAKLSISKLVP
jgi:hypothetical protein